MKEEIIEWEAETALIFIARILMMDDVNFKYTDGTLIFNAPTWYVNNLRERLRSYTPKNIIINKFKN